MATSKSSSSGSPLPLAAIFWRYTSEATLMFAIYMVLVAGTLLLREVASLEREPSHKIILQIVENSILVASSIVILLVLLYLMAMIAIDLFFNLKKNLSQNRRRATVQIEPSSKANNRLQYIVSVVLLLGILGILEMHRRQIEQLKQ